jgi:uncharacterized membrane protein YhaH (DUF805 family)
MLAIWIAAGAFATRISLDPAEADLSSVAMIVATLCAATTVAVKRLHDRNRSGWFLWLYFVPIVGVIVLLEIGFLRGTRGPNRFGPDPFPGQPTHAPPGTSGGA